MACWLGVLATLILAPQSLPQPGSNYTITDNVQLVLLDVAVRDSHKHYVSGLGQGNFRVYENGHERRITVFSGMDEPVSIGLVLDTSGSMRNKRPYIILAGLAFAKESNPHDQFFVVNFNNTILKGLPPRLAFTDQLRELRAALSFGTPQGQTALYDAVAYSLEHLELSRYEKRTLIIVSDGRDNVSHIGFPQLMNVIEASRATIYTIGVYDNEDLDADPGVLRAMARVSGGEFFQPEKLEDVTAIFGKISADIRSRYMIGYPPEEFPAKQTLRKIRVTAEESGHKFAVRTRASYVNVPASPDLEVRAQ